MAAPEPAASDEGDRPALLSVSTLTSTTTAAVAAVAEAAAAPVSAAVSAVNAVTTAIAEPVQRIRSAAVTTTARVTGQPHQTGAASYHADKFHGRKTASGETFDNGELTMAHHAAAGHAGEGDQSGQQHQRGGAGQRPRPYSGGRVADLSRAAAESSR